MGWDQNETFLHNSWHKYIYVEGIGKSFSFFFWTIIVIFHKEIQYERKKLILLADQKDQLRQVLSLARLLGYYIFQFFF